MFVIKDTEAWVKFLELYHKGRADTQYQYSMEDVIALTRLVHNAGMIEVNEVRCRELAELYHDYLLAKVEDRKPISPLFYLQLGCTTVTGIGTRPIINDAEGLVRQLRDTNKVTRAYVKNLFDVEVVESPKDWWYVIEFIYVATRLFGYADNVANHLTPKD